MPAKGPEDVLEFWFSDRTRPFWFKQDAAFDEKLRKDFGLLWEAAQGGGCAQWEAGPEAAVALVIVLDQFPRNMFRGDRRSFSTDELAVLVSRRAIDAGFDQSLDAKQRQFLYMPFVHSESLEDQARACELFAQPGMPGPEWAEKHKVIIERFGRFPHRNDVLDRECTADEIEFLKGPGSSF